MTGITVAGVGSGLDVNKIVTDLIASERKVADTRLDTKKALLEAKVSAIGTIKGAISDFQTALSGITSASNFKSMTTAVSDTTFTANATTAAQTGDYSVLVNNLAQSQKLITSDTLNFQNTTDVVGTGTLTFEFGRYSNTEGNASSDDVSISGDINGDAITSTFIANTAKTSQSVVITSANNTLSGVRDAINNANIGVRASIINDGTEYRITLSSTDTGAKNSLRISVTNDGDSNQTDQVGLSVLAYDPAVIKNMTRTVQAKDASLTIDGQAITSATNSVSTAIPGVTLTLKTPATTATAATLSVSQDTSVAAKAVSTLVEAYNTLKSTTKTLTAYDATDKNKNGILLGDVTISTMLRRVNTILTNAVTGVTGTTRTLSAVGVSFQKDGTLSLDSAKLQTALTQDASGVAALFTRTGKTTDSLVTYNSLRTSSTSAAGTYDVRTSRLATQGQYVSTGTSLTIDGSNNTVGIKVNGTSATVSLTQKTYTTGAELAAELQTQINANSTLVAAGASVTVSYDGGANAYTFTSSTYGTSSSVTFTAANTALGVSTSIGTATIGQNAAGWITEPVATQGQYASTSTGTGVGSFTIDNTNNSIWIKVNGIELKDSEGAATKAITLTNGTYTGAELAAHLQSQINNNPNTTFSKAGIVVGVAYDSTTGQFTYTSNAYGSGSAVAFTAANSTLGVSSTTGTATAGRNGASTTSSLATQGQYVSTSTGIGVGAFTLTGESIGIKVNGTSVSVALTDGAYTGATLATELQTRINANTTLSAQGITVGVAYNSTTGQFTYTSNTYGKTSAVAFTTTNSTLGVSSTTGIATVGQDGLNTALATQGYYAGTALGASAGPFVITGSNNTLALKIDGTYGTTSGVITLSSGTYTGAALASHLQSKINADTTLSVAGKSAYVSYDDTTGTFKITSNTYTNASSTDSSRVDITSVDAALGTTLGFSVATGRAGAAGFAGATGSGRVLTGAGSAAGLAVDILGGAASSTGAFRGTISLSNGIGQQLNTFLSDLLSSTGSLGSRTTGLNTQLTEITTQRTALNTRMTALEARYRTQFTAMDTLVAQLTATGNFLTQFFDTGSKNK